MFKLCIKLNDTNFSGTHTVKPPQLQRQLYFDNSAGSTLVYKKQMKIRNLHKSEKHSNITSNKKISLVLFVFYKETLSNERFSDFLMNFNILKFVSFAIK